MASPFKIIFPVEDPQLLGCTVLPKVIAGVGLTTIVVFVAGEVQLPKVAVTL